jgi:uncharacterized membrane protein
LSKKNCLIFPSIIIIVSLSNHPLSRLESGLNQLIITDFSFSVMGLQAFWPPVAAVASLAIIVAILVLKFGERWCRARVTQPAPAPPRSSRHQDGSDTELEQWSTKTYEQNIYP